MNQAQKDPAVGQRGRGILLRRRAAGHNPTVSIADGRAARLVGAMRRAGWLTDRGTNGAAYVLTDAGRARAQQEQA